MGLPLFVEPARSVSTNKVCSKDSTNSPSQADPRRPSSRSEIRDRRNGIRRAGVRIHSPMQRATRNPREQRNFPWIESSRQQDRANHLTRTFRPYQEASLGMTGSDDRGGEPVGERIGLSDLDSWRGSPPSPLTHPPVPPIASENDHVTESLEMGWWPFDHQRSTARGRLDRQSTAFEYPLWQSWRDSHIAEISSRTFPPIFSRTASGRDISLRAIGRQTARGLSNTGSASVDGSGSRGLSAPQSMPPRRTIRMVDGLGDRDRSLSPEMWDTLLSTLTPDPQQPSAGSSFDSVPASQTAGPSSGTPSTNPDVVDEVQLETVCDSGCEYSDNEMSTADHEPLNHDQTRLQRHQPRELHPRRVPDFNLDGMSEPYLSNVGSTGGVDALSVLAVPAPLAQRTRNSGDARTSRQINTPSGSITIYESTMRLRPSAEVSRPSASRSHSTSHSNYDEASPPPQRTQFAQEEEHSIRHGPQHQDVTRSASMADSSPAEDDWVGMQRIVRSLARREDIPDGWWAEAGLSRILHQRADNSNLDVHSITDPF